MIKFSSKIQKQILYNKLINNLIFNYYQLKMIKNKVQNLANYQI